MQQSFYIFENVKTFPYLVGGLKQHSREYCIPKKEFHPQNITTSPMEIQHSHGKGLFAIMKRLKYHYHHPKPPATDHRLPRPAGHLAPPLSREFLKIYQIFPRIQFAYQTLLKYHTREFILSTKRPLYVDLV